MKKIVFPLIASIVAIAGCGGKSITIDPISATLHGREVRFIREMYYLTNFKPKLLGPGIDQYQCYLIKAQEAPNFPKNIFKENEKRLKKVESGLRFTVYSSFMVEPWGYQKAFSPEYRVLVLKTEMGRLCTILESSVEKSEWVTDRKAITNGL